MAESYAVSDDIVLVDSVNYLDSNARGKTVVASSHGGIYAAYKAATIGVRAVILNDAGIGLGNAGIACLDYCDDIKLAAAVVSYNSAKIGQSSDMMSRGIISGVNNAARKAGCDRGISCKEAVKILQVVKPSFSTPPPYEETRFVITEIFPRIICIDSASLVKPEDNGQIVITGSHGGLIGGKKEKAFNIQAFIAVFNDAGVGIEKAGIGRLDPLDERGIAAITVSHKTARIGDSRSTYSQGIISFVNNHASKLGASPDQKLKDFISKVRCDFSQGQY